MPGSRTGGGSARRTPAATSSAATPGATSSRTRARCSKNCTSCSPARLERVRRALGIAAAVLFLTSCSSGNGGDDASSKGAAPPSAEQTAKGTARDWTRYGFNAQRSNVGPSRVGFRSPGRLHRHRVRLPGTVDSSPIYLHRVRVRGRRRSVFFVTTSYGRTLAIDARTRKRLWQVLPGRRRADKRAAGAVRPGGGGEGGARPHPPAAPPGPPPNPPLRLHRLAERTDPQALRAQRPRGARLAGHDHARPDAA